MNKISIIGFVVAFLTIPHSVGAQSFKENNNIIFENPYVNQQQPVSDINFVDIKSKKINTISDTTFSVIVDGDWAFKSFGVGEVDDFSYYIDGFTAQGWDKVSSLDEINRGSTLSAFKNIYFTNIYISQYWDFREVFLQTPFSKGEYSIFINGVDIGANLDSYNSPVFNITQYVNEGFNSLLIICRSASENSKLEDGIVGAPLLNGDVVLFSTPKLRIEDYKIITYFTDDLNKGNVQLNLNIKTHLLNEKEAKLMFWLYDADGDLIGKDVRWTKLEMRSNDVVSFHVLINDVERYSAENPYIYTAIVSLVHQNRITQRIKLDIPFAEIKPENGKFIVNYAPSELYGVVWEELEAPLSNDKYIDSVLAKLEIIKENGFNSIMLNHPQRSSFYSLCDSIGLYVIDAANVDITTSGSNLEVGGTLANVPNATFPIFERVKSQYLKNKNNVSVIALRAAKSFGTGYALYQMYVDMKSIDEKMVLASNALHREWNNDFVITNLCKQNNVELSPNSLNFVTSNDWAQFNDEFYKLENRAGLFVDYQVFARELTDDGVLKNITFSSVDSLTGEFAVWLKNGLISPRNVKFRYKVELNDKVLVKQDIPSNFEDGKTSELKLDLGYINGKIISAIRLTGSRSKRDFNIVVEATISGKTVEQMSVPFKLKNN